MNLIYIRGGRKRCHYRHKNLLQCTIIHYSVFFNRTTLAGFQHDFIMTLILSFKAPFLKPYAFENIVEFFFFCCCLITYSTFCFMQNYVLFLCYLILIFRPNSPKTFSQKIAKLGTKTLIR